MTCQQYVHSGIGLLHRQSAESCTACHRCRETRVQGNHLSKYSETHHLCGPRRNGVEALVTHLAVKMSCPIDHIFIIPCLFQAMCHLLRGHVSNIDMDFCQPPVKVCMSPVCSWTGRFFCSDWRLGSRYRCSRKWNIRRTARLESLLFCSCHQGLFTRGHACQVFHLLHQSSGCILVT